jgi:hypothetical protein
MCSYDIGVFNISVIEWGKFPTRWQVLLFVLEFCDVPENCDFFNEVLQ